MKILKQLEAIIEKEGLNESAKQFYLREISELDKEKQQEIINLVDKMEQAGFKNNFSNAFSEVTENIPQFARMTVFKELHKISKDIPLDDRTAHTARPEKRKRNTRTKDFSPAMDFPEYEQRFLTSVRNGRNKSGFSIHTEILQILRDVLSDIRSEASITGYIENILLDHLKTYQDLLNHTASQRRRDKIIDL